MTSHSCTTSRIAQQALPGCGAMRSVLISINFVFWTLLRPGRRTLLIERTKNFVLGDGSVNRIGYKQINIEYAVLRDPAGWLSVNPVRGTVNTSASLDRESPYVHNNKYTAVFIATDNGSPPATGTGSLVIHLQDYNDNAPYVFPSVARVCEDAQDMNVAVVGGRDRDIHPNAGPFKIELGKQPGLDKTWKVTRVNSTHSQILLLHSLKKDNYQLPLLITDSGVPPLSNNTEVKVQVCVCKKNKMHCSSAWSHRASLLVPLVTVLLLSLCL